MLRFFKYGFLVSMILVFMACPAPSTSSSAQKPVDQTPSTPEYVPPAGLPDKIEDIIDLSRNYWAGKTATGELFYFKKPEQADYYRIEIIAKDTNDRTNFYARKGSGIVQNGVWEANFYLPDNKNNFDLSTEMECQMRFLSLQKAEVKFFPKKPSNKTKNYGTFHVSVM